MALCKDIQRKLRERQERDRTRRLYITINLYTLSIFIFSSLLLPAFSVGIKTNAKKQSKKANKNKIKYNSSCLAMLLEGLRSFTLLKFRFFLMAGPSSARGIGMRYQRRLYNRILLAQPWEHPEMSIHAALGKRKKKHIIPGNENIQIQNALQVLRPKPKPLHLEVKRDFDSSVTIIIMYSTILRVSRIHCIFFVKKDCYQLGSMPFEAGSRHSG